MLQVHLNIGDFGVAPQEIVLVQRHGRVDESPDDPHTVQKELYRAVQRLIAKEHEISGVVTVETAGAKVSVEISRIYNHRGYLYRIGYPGVGAIALRERQGLKPHEKRILRMAAYLVEKSTGVRPAGLRYVFHELTTHKESGEVAVHDSVMLPVEHGTLLEMESEFVAFVSEIVAAMSKRDEDLPECSGYDRRVSRDNAFGKCAFHCKARAFCWQRARYYKDLLERFSPHKPYTGPAVYPPPGHAAHKE